MGTDYVWVKATIEAPETYIVLRDKKTHNIIEIYFETIKAWANKGLDFLESGLSLKQAVIKDCVSNSYMYPNLLETYIPVE